MLNTVFEKLLQISWMWMTSDVACRQMINYKYTLMYYFCLKTAYLIYYYSFIYVYKLTNTFVLTIDNLVSIIH